MRLLSTAALLAALACAGCSTYGEATAVTVHTDKGQVVTNEWSGAARCGSEPGARAPCSASAGHRRTP
jgi:hypothetical protein